VYSEYASSIHMLLWAEFHVARAARRMAVVATIHAPVRTGTGALAAGGVETIDRSGALEPAIAPAAVIGLGLRV
jgi:hypothetical protein